MDRPLSARGVTFAALMGIVVVAVAVRVAGTGERTLFWDEAYHLRLAVMPVLSEMLDAILANPPSDPLYALFLRGWIGIAGTSDPLIRLPSVVFGAATVLATAWLAWELTRSRRVALSAAFLVAIAPYAVEFGQEASLYAFATLWVTLALAAGWRWRRSGQWQDGALTVALAIVAVYSHYVAAAVIGLAAVVSLTPLAGPRQISARSLAMAASVVLIAWAPWFVPMAASWVSAPYPRTTLAHAASVTELLGALSQYSSGTGALLERVRPLQVLGAAAATLLVARAWLIARRPDLRGLRVVSMVSLLLFVGPWLASVVTGRWLFVPHLMLPVLPALAVVAAAGGLLPPADNHVDVARPTWRQAVAAGALAGLVGAQLAGLYVDAVHPPHGDDGIPGLAGTLAAEVEAGEPVFITPSEFQLVMDHYWSGPLFGLPADVDLKRLYEPYEPEIWRAGAIRRFSELSANSARAWVVYNADRDAGGSFLAWLGEQGELTRRGSYQLADLYVVSLR